MRPRSRGALSCPNERLRVHTGMGRGRTNVNSKRRNDELLGRSIEARVVNV
jgi:hypothetical protein